MVCLTLPLNCSSSFIASRRQGLSHRTLEFYQDRLTRATSVIGIGIKPFEIQDFFDNLKCSNGGKHAYWRALIVFYHWLYSPKSGLGLSPQDNPMLLIESPKVERRILPSLNPEQINYLIEHAESIRDKAIISLFADSGLRLNELASIQVTDIDWANCLVKVWRKGGKQGYAPFGHGTKDLLRLWLADYKVNGNIWGINRWGIIALLRRLEAKTGLTCNPHTFRHSFASILAKRGVDSLHIQRLGGWSNLQMVQLYTRSVQFYPASPPFEAVQSRAQVFRPTKRQIWRPALLLLGTSSYR